MTWTQGILIKFADYTKLGGAVDSFKGREALQRDLDKLGYWAVANYMKFNKGKYWILRLGWCNPRCTGNEKLENSAMERDTETLADRKLNISQQCPGSQEGQPCPEEHQAQHRQGIVPL
ncbi:rna-directed dna polymerase from mobile element jockey-like [Willisornis vidua]|uniref:Rna-directed dna polymerase from mobile element jockey-like n=1 Tax=Willisornis vidua TaxID=1566151 RepID=A0ABQ9DE31_9PASS|nr:rna-directed dna polymerase from mobile element jockey-like [Willisornis vidua]